MSSPLKPVFRPNGIPAGTTPTLANGLCCWLACADGACRVWHPRGEDVGAVYYRTALREVHWWHRTPGDDPAPWRSPEAAVSALLDEVLV